jgi:hypothetical protein
MYLNLRYAKKNYELESIVVFLGCYICSLVWWNAARLYGVMSKDWNTELGHIVMKGLFIVCPYKSV